MKLTYKILGQKTDDLLDILKQLAPELGLSHIAYIRLASNKSLDSSFLTATATYPIEWQRRYFSKEYFLIDAIMKYGGTSSSHFDWQELERGDQVIKDFFLDAVRHKVGSNGFSTGSKLPDDLDVNLSLREEQCLMWAARGKTYKEIGEITNLSFYSVRSHLDVARSKLHGRNLTHAVAIALALGVIPSMALRESALKET